MKKPVQPETVPKPVAPYLRRHVGLGGVLVVLTEIRERALVIVPNGNVEVRSLMGVSAVRNSPESWEDVSRAQRATLSAWASTP